MHACGIWGSNNSVHFCLVPDSLLPPLRRRAPKIMVHMPCRRAVSPGGLARTGTKAWVLAPKRPQRYSLRAPHENTTAHATGFQASGANPRLSRTCARTTHRPARTTHAQQRARGPRTQAQRKGGCQLAGDEKPPSELTSSHPPPLCVARAARAATKAGSTSCGPGQEEWGLPPKAAHPRRSQRAAPRCLHLPPRVPWRRCIWPGHFNGRLAC